MKVLGRVFFALAIFSAISGFISAYIVDNYVMFFISLGAFVVSAIGTAIFAKDLKKWIWSLLDLF